MFVRTENALALAINLLKNRPTQPLYCRQISHGIRSSGIGSNRILRLLTLTSESDSLVRSISTDVSHSFHLGLTARAAINSTIRPGDGQRSWGTDERIP